MVGGYEYDSMLVFKDDTSIQKTGKSKKRKIRIIIMYFITLYKIVDVCFMIVRLKAELIVGFEYFVVNEYDDNH